MRTGSRITDLSCAKRFDDSSGELKGHVMKTTWCYVH